MTQPDKQPSPALTRPAIGVLVDPERMAAARKSAMLERIELAALSQALDLLKIAETHGIHVDQDPKELVEHPAMVTDALRAQLDLAGVTVKKTGLRIGVSRDEIAKLESRHGKRPKITTLRKLIDALNYARALRGKPDLDIEDLQVPGEVLIPEPRDNDEIPQWEHDLLEEQARQQALDAYQEASNDIYYAEKNAARETDDGTLPG